MHFEISNGMIQVTETAALKSALNEQFRPLLQKVCDLEKLLAERHSNIVQQEDQRKR